MNLKKSLASLVSPLLARVDALQSGLEEIRRGVREGVAVQLSGDLRQKLEFIERQNRRVFFSTSTYVGDHTAITWMTSGQRIFVDTRDLGVAQHLMFKGYWEKTTNTALLELLEVDATYVDVGAHYGSHVLPVAQKLARGRVVAVEPNTRLHALLTKSVRINGLRDRVSLHRCAISSNEGEARFVCPEDDPALGRLVGTDAEEPDAITVPIRPLDDLLADQERIDVMKIDVEGHELEALAGAEKILRRHHGMKLILEYAPAMIERNTSLETFHGRLRELGFEHVYEIGREGRRALTSYDLLGERRELRNLILSRDAL